MLTDFLYKHQFQGLEKECNSLFETIVWLEEKMYK
jgi:hypothetical protein